MKLGLLRKGMNEIELRDRILKDLYEKDKLNGVGIYSIDEIAAKYGIIDFHRVQRIVKNWDFLPAGLRLLFYNTTG